MLICLKLLFNILKCEYTNSHTSDGKKQYNVVFAALFHKSALLTWQTSLVMRKLIFNIRQQKTSHLMNFVWRNLLDRYQSFEKNIHSNYRTNWLTNRQPLLRLELGGISEMSSNVHPKMWHNNKTRKAASLDKAEQRQSNTVVSDRW